jgi:chemotaxis methyl-accepting protein methylase
MSDSVHFGNLQDLKTSRLGRRPLVHDTFFFRTPELFPKLAKALPFLYPDGADIISYGCSDGSELITMFATVKSCMPDKLDQFTFTGVEPRGSKALAKARAGEYAMTQFETECFGRHFEDLFEPLPQAPKKESPLSNLLSSLRESRHDSTPPDAPYRLRDSVKALLNYREGDILQETARPEFAQGRPKIVLFRHAWYLLKPEERKRLAQQLADRLPQGSMVVIGESRIDDWCAQAPDYLKASGFKTIPYPQLEIFCYQRALAPWQSLPRF